MESNSLAVERKQTKKESSVALDRGKRLLSMMIRKADSNQRHNLKQELEEIKALIEIAQKE
jgi:hypothetical protein